MEEETEVEFGGCLVVVSVDYPAQWIDGERKRENFGDSFRD